MSVAISTDTKVNKIKFNKRALYSNSSIKIKSTDKLVDTITSIDKKCQYLKIVVDVTTDDTTISTLSQHNILCGLILTYEETVEDDTNETQSSTTQQYKSSVMFTPRYNFETTTSQYTVVQLDNNTLQSIRLIIQNNEESTITVNSIKLYYSLYTDSESIDEKIDKAKDEIIDELSNTYQQGVVFDIVTSLPDISTVPNGYACIVSTLLV
jgi:hypothetical protein